MLFHIFLEITKTGNFTNYMKQHNFLKGQKLKTLHQIKKKRKRINPLSLVPFNEHKIKTDVKD